MTHTIEDTVVRALAISAAGGHNLLLIGPPSSDRKALARFLSAILPPMTQEERGESAAVWSACGLDAAKIMEGARPFRAPHHSASLPTLIGGGNPVVPGEASLAHNGVLFLDELEKFSGCVLPGLSQAVEDGEVRLVRVGGCNVFPARFHLVMAASPCPCGHLDGRGQACSCSPAQVSRYRRQLSAPLRGCIDLACGIKQDEKFGKMLEDDAEILAGHMADQVAAARERAAARQAADGKPEETASLANAVACCRLKEHAERVAEQVSDTRHLAKRDIIRVLRVARTIADLKNCERVGEEHLLEAFAYSSGGFFDWDW